MPTFWRGIGAKLDIRFLGDAWLPWIVREIWAVQVVRLVEQTLNPGVLISGKAAVFFKRALSRRGAYLDLPMQGKLYRFGDPSKKPQPTAKANMSRLGSQGRLQWCGWTSMRVSQIRGTILRFPIIRTSILGSIFGPPILGSYHMVQKYLVNLGS